MEKLELKHLAPYFAYGLNFKAKEKGMYWKYPNHMNEGFIFEFDIFDTPKKLSIGRDGFTWLDQLLYDSNPILRQLSDLTKEIEVNGEKFVPRDTDLLGKYEILVIGGKFDFFDGMGSNENIFDLPYEAFEKLFEWHFDVFGLIEAGLAIDINTLQK